MCVYVCVYILSNINLLRVKKVIISLSLQCFGGTCSTALSTVNYYHTDKKKLLTTIYDNMYLELQPKKKKQ